MGKLLTVKELEEVLKVKRHTIYRWRRESGLPYKIIGKGSVRFDLQEVHNWIKEQER